MCVWDRRAENDLEVKIQLLRQGDSDIILSLFHTFTVSLSLHLVCMLSIYFRHSLSLSHLSLLHHFALLSPMMILVPYSCIPSLRHLISLSPSLCLTFPEIYIHSQSFKTRRPEATHYHSWAWNGGETQWQPYCCWSITVHNVHRANRTTTTGEQTAAKWKDNGKWKLSRRETMALTEAKRGQHVFNRQPGTWRDLFQWLF